jgi:YVTN family beta-propeller protein
MAEERVYVVNSYVHQPSDINFSTVLMTDGDLNVMGTSKNLGDDAHSVAVNAIHNDIWVTVPDSNLTVVLDGRDLYVKHTLRFTGLDGPMGVAIRPVSTEVYITGSKSGTVSVVDENTYAELASIDVGGHPYAVVFAPDGDEAYILDTGTNELKVIKTSDRSVIKTLTWTPSDRLQEMAINSTRLYITNQKLAGQIEVIRTSDNTKLSPITTTIGYPRALGMPLSSQYLFIGYCTGTAASEVSMMRLSDQTVVSSAAITNCARRMAVRLNGTRLFVADHNSNELFGYNVAGETLSSLGAVSTDTSPGYSNSSPVGVALMYINIYPYFAVYRPSDLNNWIVTDDLSSVKYRNHYGSGTDTPLIGDMNNDREVDRAVFRNGEWIIDYNMDGSVDIRDDYGMAGDVPLIGDFNNDWIMDRAVFRSSTFDNWILDYNMDGSVNARNHYGGAGDIPIVGDFNNDWVTDRAVFRSATLNNWIIDYGMDGTVDVRERYGMAGDLPLVGKFNSDLFMDRAVFRNGEWIVDYTMDGSVDRRANYGMAGDRPLSWWNL